MSKNRINSKENKRLQSEKPWLKSAVPYIFFFFLPSEGAFHSSKGVYFFRREEVAKILKSKKLTGLRYRHFFWGQGAGGHVYFDLFINSNLIMLLQHWQVWFYTYTKQIIARGSGYHFKVCELCLYIASQSTLEIKTWTPNSVHCTIWN